MGKNKKKSNNKKNNSKSNNTNSSINKIEVDPTIDVKKYPFVSVCTPTYNRRPFISTMIQCFNHQIYPKSRMEWIIIDDGTDKIEDLVKDHPNIKYFKYDEKLPLGKKRNLLHKKCTGHIIVYMDDDDYYPPERVSHAVEKLQSDPQALCSGSSEIYIYFKSLEKMYQFGPYGPRHATAGTFAFKRALIESSEYEDDACLAEERAFLKNYTIPFIQLDPLKTILVISHEHNTFDKRKLLENPHPKFVKESTKVVDDFIKESDLKEKYMNIDSLLKNYDPGRPEMKPDVLRQLVKIEEERRKNAEKLMSQQGGQITINQEGKEPRALKSDEVIQIIQQQQRQIQELSKKGQITIQQPGKEPKTLTNDEVIQLIQQQQRQIQELSKKGQITIQQPGKEPEALTNDEVIQLIQQQQKKIQEQQQQLEEQLEKINYLDKKILELESKNN